MAGGNPVEVFNAGAYDATATAKQGDLGSRILPRRPTDTVWKTGAVAKVRGYRRFLRTPRLHLLVL